MLTYLYLLDYPDGDPELVFGVPNEPIHEDMPRAGSVCHSDSSHRAKEGNEMEEYAESDACSSVFDLIPHGDVTPMFSTPNELRLPTRSSPQFSRNQSVDNLRLPTSPLHNSKWIDPSHRPSLLAIHTQIFKAAVRFGIPCLAVHACDKFRKRIRVVSITTAEILEAADEAYTESEATLECHLETPTLKKMQHSLIQALRGRWASVRKQKDFEDVVLRRPELGRDLMRLL
jgi:hypothetical protein